MMKKLSVQALTLTNLAICITGVSVIMGAYTLCKYIVYFADLDAFVRDSSLYWAVGKGIVNGLVPYQDIFENKPPGVFLLSALSFSMFQSGILGNVLGVLSLLSAPVVCFLGGQNAAKGLLSRKNLWLLSMIGFVIGSLWSFVLILKVGPWQIELFGFFFAVWYTFFLTKKHSRLRTVGLTVMLFLATGMKEPFLLSCLGAAILWSKDLRTFKQTFLIPCALAVTLGVTALFFFGFLIPYLTIDMPILFGFRMLTAAPLWLRLLGYWPLAKVLWQVSVVLPFLTLVLIVLQYRNPHTVNVKNVLKTLFPTAIALFVSVTAIGIAGDFQPHHFGFFGPFFIAIVLRAEETLSETRSEKYLSRVLLFLSIVAALATCTTVAPTDPRWNSRYVQSLRDDAASLDTILNRCHISRYLEIVPVSNQIPLFAFTKHSPLNQSVYLQIDGALQYGQAFFDQSVRALSRAQVIAIPKDGYKPTNPIGELMKTYITETFSSTQPECSLPRVTTTEYDFFYRTKTTPFHLNIKVNFQ